MVDRILILFSETYRRLVKLFIHTKRQKPKVRLHNKQNNESDCMELEKRLWN